MTHKTLSIILAFAFGGLCFFAPSTAHAEDDFKKMPWHLIDLWWDLGEETEFDSYSIDVTIGEGIAPETKLYIAPIGLAHFNKAPFYGGIQTQLGNAYNRDREPRRNLGPGFIFSRWGERDLAAVRIADGGVCESSGYEGDFISVRNPVAWTAGTYTCRLSRMNTVTIDDKTYTWVGMFMESHQTKDEAYVGALRFEGETLTFSRRVASFVEIYGRAVPVEEIPRTAITFNNLRVNGKPIEQLHVSANYPQGVPDVATTEADDDKQGVTITLGDLIERPARSESVF